VATGAEDSEATPGVDGVCGRDSQSFGICFGESEETDLEGQRLVSTHAARGRTDLSWLAFFQVLRNNPASLGHDAGIDPKVAADRRGHAIGMETDV
jgi:hypothetical protein